MSSMINFSLSIAVILTSTYCNIRNYLDQKEASAAVLGCQTAPHRTDCRDSLALRRWTYLEDLRVSGEFAQYEVLEVPSTYELHLD